MFMANLVIKTVKVICSRAPGRSIIARYWLFVYICIYAYSVCVQHPPKNRIATVHTQSIIYTYSSASDTKCIKLTARLHAWGFSCFLYSCPARGDIDTDIVGGMYRYIFRKGVSERFCLMCWIRIMIVQCAYECDDMSFW